MKNATVTINYVSFQSIMEKADKYDELVRTKEDVLNKNDSFIDVLCTCLEKANEQRFLQINNISLQKVLKQSVTVLILI